jgi:hypothetical protein
VVIDDRFVCDDVASLGADRYNLGSATADESTVGVTGPRPFTQAIGGPATGAPPSQPVGCSGHPASRQGRVAESPPG